MKPLKRVFILTFLIFEYIAFCQESDKSKSTPYYGIAYGSNGICLTNIDEGTSTLRLTDGDHGYPAWSPDGKYIAFYAYHDQKKRGLSIL